MEKLGNRETNAKLIEELLLYLKGFPLTKAEKLQIVNILPRSEVEFYLVSLATLPTHMLLIIIW